MVEPPYIRGDFLTRSRPGSDMPLRGAPGLKIVYPESAPSGLRRDPMQPGAYLPSFGENIREGNYLRGAPDGRCR